MKKAIATLILALAPTWALDSKQAIGSLTAAEQAVTIEAKKYPATSFQLTGTWSATVTFEASVDGTNYVAVPAFNVNTGAAATTATANGVYTLSTAGTASVRARVSSYSSGTVVVTGIASEGSGVVYQVGTPSNWNCGLDNIGTTLTECQAAPGASLKLYVTGLVAQSTTSTAGTFGLRRGTGTNCGTGTGNVLSSATATARFVAPANTAAPTVVTFPSPIALPANEALCVLGVATNTTTIQIVGYTAP